MKKPGVLESARMADVGPWDVADIDTSSRSIKSAERTLALFELFSLQERPLTVGEISRMLDIPQPSVSMLLRNLVKLGYLDHDRQARTFVPNIRIMLLGSWVHRRFNENLHLEEMLDRLLARIGETVILAIQNGIWSQYVSAQMPEKPARMEVQSGLLRPITCTAVGRVLLSNKADAEIEMIVRRCNAEVSEERLRVHPPTFLELIHRVRAAGFAETRGDMTPGYGAIAIAISSPMSNIPMAVSVGATNDHLEQKHDLILDAMLELKARLAHSPDPEDSVSDT